MPVRPPVRPAVGFYDRVRRRLNAPHDEIICTTFRTPFPSARLRSRIDDSKLHTPCHAGRSLRPLPPRPPRPPIDILDIVRSELGERSRMMNSLWLWLGYVIWTCSATARLTARWTRRTECVAEAAAFGCKVWHDAVRPLRLIDHTNTHGQHALARSLRMRQIDRTMAQKF